MQKMLDWLLAQAKIKKPVIDPDAPRYGEMIDRMAAAAIDVGILFFLFNRLFLWISAQIYRHADQTLVQQAKNTPNLMDSLQLAWQSGAVALWFLNALVQCILIGFFVVGAQVAWQTTPGKGFLGLKIVRRRTFAPVEPWRYVVRFLGYIFFPGVVFAHFNKERRAFHDMIAGTVVLQTRPPGWYWKQVKRGFVWAKHKLASKKA